MDEKQGVRRAGHALEQAEKHAKLLHTNPGEAQFHLDSIALLLQETMAALGAPLPVAPKTAPAAPKVIPLEPDFEDVWRQEMLAKRPRP